MTCFLSLEGTSFASTTPRSSQLRPLTSPTSSLAVLPTCTSTGTEACARAVPTTGRRSRRASVLDTGVERSPTRAPGASGRLDSNLSPEQPAEKNEVAAREHEPRQCPGQRHPETVLARGRRKGVERQRRGDVGTQQHWPPRCGSGPEQGEEGARGAGEAEAGIPPDQAQYERCRRRQHEHREDPDQRALDGGCLKLGGDPCRRPVDEWKE